VRLQHALDEVRQARLALETALHALTSSERTMYRSAS
jgi:hypothetical protein